MNYNKLLFNIIMAVAITNSYAANKTRIDGDLTNRDTTYVNRGTSNLRSGIYQPPLIKPVTGAVANVQRDVFVSSGTWTVPTGVSAIRVLLVGGGGAGSSAENVITTGCWNETTFSAYQYCVYGNYARAGSGGGSGQIVDTIIDVTAISSLSVVVGAGGNSAVNVSSEVSIGSGGGMGEASSIGTPGNASYRVAYGGAGGDTRDATYGYMAGGHGYAGGGGAANRWMATSTGHIGLTNVPAFKNYTSYGGISPVGAHGSSGLMVANTTSGFQYLSNGSGGGGYNGYPADTNNLLWDNLSIGSLAVPIAELKSSGAGGIGYWGRGGRGGEGSAIPYAATTTKYASACGEGMGFGAGGAGGYITTTLAATLTPAYPTFYKGAGGGGGFIPDDYYPTGSLANIYKCNDFQKVNQHGTTGRQGIIIIEYMH